MKKNGIVPYGIFLCMCLCVVLFAWGAEPEENVKKCHSLADIKSRGKLLVGVYNDNPYFSYMNPQSYQLEGFDVDMAHALAKEIMGDPNKLEFVVIDSKNRIDTLKQGKIDLILAELSMTQERRKIVDFSDIYYVAGQSILVNADSTYKSLKDLSGKTIGALSGSTNAEHAEDSLPDSKFIYFANLSSGFQALRQHQIQAFCIDDVMLLALRNDSQGVLQGYRFIGGEISWENYGIAVNKGCAELLDAVNQALQKIKSDGRWQKIYDENIGKISKVSAHPPN